MMKIKLEFSGGMELLFGGITHQEIEFPEQYEGAPAKLENLVFWIKDNLLKEKEELFLQDNTVRPGILVLINDSDWELEDGAEYQLANNDTITFISTLHGG
ncbi:hypothetical protein BB561_000105 [Smittium simulii]|uniref:Ubiquitin-related modifier 1 n=1 Tax=Smittium simulii TaxID=133385 RepID=A0A2T9Z0L6_9FUNG|nr:hypothetical protein BB561_000105 [Smittium simulii]